MKAVITIHGINTRGVWQKQLTPALCKAGFVVYPLDYDFFSPISLLLPWRRQAKVDWLRSEIERVRKDSGDPTPSIIAHSFGSYLLGAMIRDYSGQVFDKVILVGSIVHHEFDWDRAFIEGKLNWAHVEYGRLDIWPRVASKLISDAGMSGYAGFNTVHPFVAQQEFKGYGHSTWFSDDHARSSWLGCLTQNRRGLSETLRKVRGVICNVLDLEYSNVRSKVQIRNEMDTLTTVPGLTMGVPYQYQALPLNSLDQSVNYLHAAVGNAYFNGSTTVIENNPTLLVDPVIDSVGSEVSFRIVSPVKHDGEVAGVVTFDIVGGIGQDETRTALVESLARQIDAYSFEL